MKKTIVTCFDEYTISQCTMHSITFNKVIECHFLQGVFKGNQLVLGSLVIEHPLLENSYVYRGNKTYSLKKKLPLKDIYIENFDISAHHCTFIGKHQHETIIISLNFLGNIVFETVQ